MIIGVCIEVGLKFLMFYFMLVLWVIVSRCSIVLVELVVVVIMCVVFWNVVWLSRLEGW